MQDGKLKAAKQKRGGARKGAGVKSERAEPLFRLEIKVYADQAAYIRQTKNASAFVRALISDAMGKLKA